MHGAIDRSSSEQIGRSVPQFAGRGAAENELQGRVLFHLGVNDIKEFGDTLHFINNGYGRDYQRGLGE